MKVVITIEGEFSVDDVKEIEMCFHKGLLRFYLLYSIFTFDWKISWIKEPGKVVYEISNLPKDLGDDFYTSFNKFIEEKRK